MNITTDFELALLLGPFLSDYTDEKCDEMMLTWRNSEMMYLASSPSEFVPCYFFFYQTGRQTDRLGFGIGSDIHIRYVGSIRS